MFKIGDEVRCPSGLALGESFWRSKLSGVGTIVEKATTYDNRWRVNWDTFTLYHLESELEIVVPVLAEPIFKVGDKIVYTAVDHEYIPSALGQGTIKTVEPVRDENGLPKYQTYWPLCGRTYFFSENRLGAAPVPVPTPVVVTDPRKSVSLYAVHFLSDEGRKLAHSTSDMVNENLSSLSDVEQLEALSYVISDLMDDMSSMRRCLLSDLGARVYS